MTLEEIFLRWSLAFQFVVWAQFSFLNGISGAVYFHFVVRFCMVCGALSCWQR
jgi:hypothetical protein